jgi:hypothetical protein
MGQIVLLKLLSRPIRELASRILIRQLVLGFDKSIEELSVREIFFFERRLLGFGQLAQQVAM